MPAPVGKRFRSRGSVGALRSVYSFYNVSPGMPGKYPAHYFTEMPPDAPTPGARPSSIMVYPVTRVPAETQAIQFLVKEGIIKIADPVVPATPKGTFPIEGFRISPMAKARLLRGYHFGTLGFPKGTAVGRPMRTPDAVPAALASVVIPGSGDRPAAGIRAAPTMRASASNHRRRLRRLAGEPGFGGP